jgi:hypothetical protein
MAIRPGSAPPPPQDLMIMDAYDRIQACEAMRATFKDEEIHSRSQCVATPPSSPCLKVAAWLTQCPIGCGGVTALKSGDADFDQWYFACRHLLIH